LARRIAAHQPLQRRRLVRYIVIDVQTGELRPACHDKIDESFERALLVGARERPLALTDESTARVPEEIAEQIFQAMLADEGVAFEVEKHIAFGSFGFGVSARVFRRTVASFGSKLKAPLRSILPTARI